MMLSCTVIYYLYKVHHLKAQFSLCTADCRSTGESCPLVTFTADAELVGKINNDEDALYQKQIENFVNLVR